METFDDVGLFAIVFEYSNTWFYYYDRLLLQGHNDSMRLEPWMKRRRLLAEIRRQFSVSDVSRGCLSAAWVFKCLREQARLGKSITECAKEILCKISYIQYL